MLEKTFIVLAPGERHQHTENPPAVVRCQAFTQIDALLINRLTVMETRFLPGVLVYNVGLLHHCC